MTKVHLCSCGCLGGGDPCGDNGVEVARLSLTKPFGRANAYDPPDAEPVFFEFTGLAGGSYCLKYVGGWYQMSGSPQDGFYTLATTAFFWNGTGTEGGFNPTAGFDTHWIHAGGQGAFVFPTAAEAEAATPFNPYALNFRFDLEAGKRAGFSSVHWTTDQINDWATLGPTGPTLALYQVPES